MNCFLKNDQFWVLINPYLDTTKGQLERKKEDIFQKFNLA